MRGQTLPSFQRSVGDSVLPRISTSEEAVRNRKEARVIDAHVGQRIRGRRTELGMSQTQVADALGVTFQQVQKYERGANLVGASRLYDLSNILDRPVEYFFEGLTPTPKSEAEGTNLRSPETVELVNAYYKVDNPHVRRQILSTIRSISFGE